MPKFLGVDREQPRVESGQRAMAQQVARQRAEAETRPLCVCECCRTAPSPKAPGRDLCYSCLYAGCLPSTECVFAGASLAKIEQERLDWEGKHRRLYLALAGEWMHERPASPEYPMGRRFWWQRFLVKRN